MLTGLILIPLLTAVLVGTAPAAQAKFYAGIGVMVSALLYTYIAFQFYTTGNAYQFDVSVPWLPDLGISYTLSADSLSMMLVGLTVFLGPICVFGSFSAITTRVRTYYAWLLILQSAMTGVFFARDAVLFYIFFEFTLVPMFILISLYGSTNRKSAAIKFFLYTFTGSVITLAGVVYVAWFNATQIAPGGTAWAAGQWSFDFGALQQAANAMPAETQRLVFLALMLGFAIKVPIFPLHTWLPLAHTEAPTAGSVILAGVLLKLGTYGIFKIAIPFCPEAAMHYAPFIGTLACLGIIVGGLICWVQTDVKKLVAYSSVAHLGFCMLGMFALNKAGLQGSILYMLNHGLSTGALFLCIGMVYERYHTRSMRELGGLAAKMPVWSTFMVFFTMASVGLPGLNGFVSEFLCLLGAFQAGDIWDNPTVHTIAGTGGAFGPGIAFIAGTGMIIAAMYLLLMLGKIVWGPLVEPSGHGHHGDSHSSTQDSGPKTQDATPHLPTDLNPREISLLVALAIPCLLFGVYPKPLLDSLDEPVTTVRALIERQRDGQIYNAAQLRSGIDRAPTPAAPRKAAKPGDEKPAPTTPPAKQPPADDRPGEKIDSEGGGQ